MHADDYLAPVSDCAAGRCQEVAPELAQNGHDAVEELARDGAQELAAALPDDAQEVVQDAVKELENDAMVALLTFLSVS